MGSWKTLEDLIASWVNCFAILHYVINFPFLKIEQTFLLSISYRRGFMRIFLRQPLTSVHSSIWSFFNHFRQKREIDLKELFIVIRYNFTCFSCEGFLENCSKISADYAEILGSFRSFEKLRKLWGLETFKRLLTNKSGESFPSN